MVDVTMPRLSDSMEEGTIVEWLKVPGEAVAKGDPLVEVETDQATIVDEAEHDGVLSELVVAAGGSAPLGAVIARIAVGAAADDLPEHRAPPVHAVRARATPVARRLARELGVALDGVSGTGPG